MISRRDAARGAERRNATRTAVPEESTKAKPVARQSSPSCARTFSVLRATRDTPITRFSWRRGTAA
jgi:hypothetical protein